MNFWTFLKDSDYSQTKFIPTAFQIKISGKNTEANECLGIFVLAILLLSQEPYLHFCFAAVGKSVIRNESKRDFLIIIAGFEVKAFVFLLAVSLGFKAWQ